MNDAQIKHMVDRFLGWKLPKDFRPDAGISFKAEFNEHTAHPMKHEPTGTNLFDVTQATAMVRYILEGLPAASADAEKLERIKQLYDTIEPMGGRHERSSHARHNLEGALIDMQRTGKMDAVCEHTIQRVAHQLSQIEDILGI